MQYHKQKVSSGKVQLAGSEQLILASKLPSNQQVLPQLALYRQKVQKKKAVKLKQGNTIPLNLGVHSVKKRTNVLILGDRLGDLGMSDGLNYENQIVVGFLWKDNPVIQDS